MRSPLVSAAMSTPVVAVPPEAPLSTARELMHAHGCRHLPVVDRERGQERICGVITLSDLYAAEAIVQADPDLTPVESLMAKDVYMVAPDAPVSEVCGHMAQAHIGSALVVRDGELLGLFTSSDACRVLAEVLADDAE